MTPKLRVSTEAGQLHNIVPLRGGTRMAAAHRRLTYKPADGLDALTEA